MPKDKLFLIDGNSFCYRAYYAIRSLTNSRGQPTNAVYGFITMLNKIIKDHKPEMIAVAFDLKGETFRHKKFEDYKIHRKPMPDDLAAQMAYIKKVVDAYRIPIYEMQGYEADDVLATLARRAEERDIDTYIVTGDKDALQLVDAHTKVVSTHKYDLVYDATAVKERYGVGPEGMVDIMALMGDATDNIPGVPGIGEKTAVELIIEFGTVEKLFENIDKVRGEAKRKILKENEKLAILSKELAVLDTNVPINIDFSQLRLKDPDDKRLLELFKELEFRSFIKELEFDEKFTANYKTIDDEKGLAELVRHLAGLKEFALDTETTSEEDMLARLVGISFAWKEAEASYVPLNGALCEKDVLKVLKTVLEDKRIAKVGQNIKYDLIVLANHGIRLAGAEFDTMVASYLLNPSKFNHNLEDISLEYLSHKMTTPIEDLLGKGKNAITMDKVPIEKVAAYCSEDSDITYRLKKVLAGEIEKKGLDKLFYEIEIPLIGVLAAMEMTGVAIDTPYLAELSAEMEKKLSKLTRKIYDASGEEFNINSPKQLSKILFEKLKLPVVKKTKTGISTDEEVLTKLAVRHELPRALLEYRELAKLKSTYVDTLPALVNPKTGRVHTSFNQTVTATGRLSSSGPNLQNIPIKTEEGRKIRKAFIPSSRENVIISADYSQIELRVLAHLSGDSHLVEAFKDGADIHSFTAALVFGVAEKDVTGEMRSMAKTVNFGIVYGMSPYGLSQSLGIEVDKAKEFIDAYFERYPDVKAYMEGLIEEAREKGYTATIFGRRRYIPEISSQDLRMRQFAERTAINTPIQGSAADIIKAAMIDIHKRFDGFKTKMILQVHDELVFDVPESELKRVIPIIKDGMENIVKLKVPVEARIETGRNWLELEPYND